jgi:hypothetical protein
MGMNSSGVRPNQSASSRISRSLSGQFCGTDRRRNYGQFFAAIDKTIKVFHDYRQDDQSFFAPYRQDDQSF